MKNQFATAYAAYEVLTEHGSHGDRIGVFRSKHLAVRAADGKGWYGGSGEVVECSIIITDDGTYILESLDPVTLDVDEIQAHKQAVAQAKAKLTPKELALLGLKP